MRPEVRKYLVYTGIVVVLVVLQVTVVPMIELFGAIPSLPLIGIGFIGLREGPTPAMLFGFPAGLMIDAYAGEVVGISALALTITGFAIGFFRDPEKTALLIRSSKAVWILAFGAVLYNLVYVFTYFRTLDFDLGGILLRHVLLTSLYTAVLSAIPVLILARSSSRLRV